MSRPEFKSITRFLCWFVPFYALLLIPWPGSRDLYGAYLRSVAKLVLTATDGRRILRFDDVPPASRNHTLDTRITVANREQLDANGFGRAIMLDFDSHGIGWVPTALLIALVVATPVPWRRRSWALAWGLLAIHALILFSIQIYIWNQSDTASGLSLIELSPFWKIIVSGLEETLVTQLGASFAIPVFIWIFATFRAEDLEALSAERRLRGRHRLKGQESAGGPTVDTQPESPSSPVKNRL
jgi:hypothetical protein